jgi:hypothetical protein
MLDDPALSPLALDPAGVLARHIGQGSQVILANPVSDEQLAPRLSGLSKVFGKLKQGACRACLEGKKARGRHLVIGLPQTLDENGDEVTLHLRIVTQTFEKNAAGPKVNLLSLAYQTSRLTRPERTANAGSPAEMCSS